MTIEDTKKEDELQDSPRGKCKRVTINNEVKKTAKPDVTKPDVAKPATKEGVKNADKA